MKSHASIFIELLIRLFCRIGLYTSLFRMKGRQGSNRYGIRSTNSASSIISAEMVIPSKIAPHTDDSTIVYVCEDKTLFVGDATCSEYPNGPKNMDRAKELADKIRSTGAVTCVEGHWQPVETEDTLGDLLA